MHRLADGYVVQTGCSPCCKAALDENSVQNEAICAGLRRKEIFFFSSVMHVTLEVCREMFLSLGPENAPKTSKQLCYL